MQLTPPVDGDLDMDGLTEHAVGEAMPETGRLNKEPSDEFSQRGVDGIARRVLRVPEMDAVVMGRMVGARGEDLFEQRLACLAARRRQAAAA